MGPSTRYASAYPSPDCHGQGYAAERECLRINSAGVYMLNSPSMMFMQNGRKDFYLSYNYDGVMFMNVDGEHIEIRQGDAFFLLPGQSVSYGYKRDGQTQNYWIHFTGHAAGALLEAFDLHNKQVITLGQHLENGIMFNRIIDELELKKPGYQAICAGYLLQLITTINRQVQDKNKTISRKKQMIADSLHYIHNHYHERLLITDLARCACMSITHFDKEFRAYTGFLPARYIMMYRIEKAVGLIVQGNVSMEQIAEMIGFENQMYFSKVFKKFMKMTPSQYKKKYTTTLEF